MDFFITISERENWKYSLPEMPIGSLSWYTDWSNPNSGMGMGIISPKYLILKLMGKMTTMFST